MSKLLIRLLIGITWIALVGLVSYIAFSSLFRVSTVEIPKSAFISNAILQQEFSHWKHQHKLRVFFMAKRQSRWINQYPMIERISVRYLPKNKLAIQLHEKQPYMSFLTSKQPIVIAKDGTILNKINPQYPVKLDHLILVKGIAASEFKGKYVNPLLLEDIQKIVTRTQPILNSDQLQIDFEPSGQVVLFKNDTFPIKLGTLENFEKKIKNLRYLYTKVPGFKDTAIDYIDLRDPDKVIVKPGGLTNG